MAPIVVGILPVKLLPAMLNDATFVRAVSADKAVLPNPFDATKLPKPVERSIAVTLLLTQVTPFQAHQLVDVYVGHVGDLLHCCVGDKLG